MYADYCCSLYAGRRELELSPVHDLCTLFRARLLAERAVLAVTIARPDPCKPRFPHEVYAAVSAASLGPASCTPIGGDGADDDDAAVLCTAVARLAAASGFEASLCERFDYESTHVRMWRLVEKKEAL